MMMRRGLLAATLLWSISIPALAAQADQKAEQPEPQKNKVISIVVYGNDPCPEGKSDEIIVCAREPEGERYRVPKQFRKPPPEPKQRSWKDRAAVADEATRSTRPNSCSAVGSGGQTGCTQEMLRQWQAEQRAKKAAADESAEPATP